MRTLFSGDGVEETSQMSGQHNIEFSLDISVSRFVVVSVVGQASFRKMRNVKWT